MSPPKVSEPEWGGDVYDPLHHVLGDVVTRHSSPPGIKLQPKKSILAPLLQRPDTVVVDELELNISIAQVRLVLNDKYFHKYSLLKSCNCSYFDFSWQGINAFIKLLEWNKLPKCETLSVFVHFKQQSLGICTVPQRMLHLFRSCGTLRRIIQYN